MTLVEIPNMEEIQFKERTKKVYKSKEGFVEFPTRRGFEEIKGIFEQINGLKKIFFNQYNWVICGGYVRYMCSNSKNVAPAGDLDIYCCEEEGFDILRKNLGLKGLKEKHENNISVTYEKITESHPWFGCPVVQLIKPIKEGAIVAIGQMEDIISNFDFTVIRCGLINLTTALVDADFEHDEERKQLRLKNIHCPISSMLRCMKYSKKGYWLTPTQALSLFVDWDNRDDDYRFKIINYLRQANEGEGLSQEEVDHLEALMRID